MSGIREINRTTQRGFTMFGLKKIFGKGREARAALGKLENRDLLQAVVYGCFYVAAADGEIEPAELDKIDRLLRNEPKLQASALSRAT